jgi:hypothetical protein
MADHPVKVPADVMDQLWDRSWAGSAGSDSLAFPGFANACARWGADQELEACCEWLRSKDILEPAIDALRSARRPKPPSLAEQGLEALGRPVGIGGFRTLTFAKQATIRAALRRLAELEAQQ